MTNFDDFLAEQMKNEEFRKEYEALEPEFVIKQAIIDARMAEGITKEELSMRCGVTKDDIDELEEGNGNPSVKTLQRLANVIGKTLRIEFV